MPYRAGRHVRRRNNHQVERDERLDRITTQLAGIDEELSRLESMPAAMTADSFYELFRGLFNRWGTLSKEERRKALAAQMPKVRIRDGRVVSLFRLGAAAR